MLFFEPLFLFQAFPAFLAAYYLLRRRTRAARWLLLLASVAFYCWGEPLFVPVVLGSAALDYVLARSIGSPRATGLRTPLLALGVAQNLGILIFYKYADFLLHTVSALTGLTTPRLGIALPIGVSFIVFEKISCLVDVHRRVTPRPQSFTEYCLFVFFFPKLLAGPIIKYHEIRDQILAPHRIGKRDVIDGLERFARGAIKKLLLADPLGTLVTTAFASPAEISMGSAWLGLLGFTLQIYFDFSAYSDMAIGLARMLGFELRENFATPYISRSLTEFWRRWHISLSTWIRDYRYLPLGGNRTSTGRTYVNLWLCFLACGLWHGAAYNYVLWGAYNGLILTLERTFLRDVLERANVFVANLCTLLCVMLGWVIFRAASITQTAQMLATLFNPLASGKTIRVDNASLLAVTIGVFVCALPRLPGYDALQQLHASNGALRAASVIGLAGLFLFACAHVFAGSLVPFVYFRF
jgi:alginate O-acetyltransferase complex protein AlgI